MRSLPKLGLLLTFAVGLTGLAQACSAQNAGRAGTIEGTVTDATGAALPKAAVSILNRVTNFQQATATDDTGTFRFANLPPNSYHLQISAPNFTTSEQDVEVRTQVPILLMKIQLEVAGTRESVTVEAAGADLLENVAYAHNDVDVSAIRKLPVTTPGSGLSDAVVLSSGAVAADSNGFFHPLGDHAQTSFSLDGQPISDQQSKNFSTQLPLNAIQSLELITGAPPADYGDKTSLIVNAVTRSGLGQKPNGSFQVQQGSFATYSEEATLGFGSAKLGNFIAANALRSGRFLDTPEVTPLHAIGTNGTIFDRLDFHPTESDVFHINISAARNWFQIPNTYDQPSQDQRQKASTFNFAPGYVRILNTKAVLTVNPFVRQDWVNYYPSRDPFADSPGTVAQNRTLNNWGVKADVSYANGRHNLKVGTQLMQTRLNESFSFGITDPYFNALCINTKGDPQALPAVTDPAKCGSAGFAANPDLQPGLLPYDLTRGGRPLRFSGRANINQYAFFAQDSIKFQNLMVQAGLRVDSYQGLATASSAQPRLGLSYLIPRSGTVLRASYSRTFETPYNENLILSSATGVGGLAANAFGAQSIPLKPGTRNQYDAGLEQTFGRNLVVSADYFWKFTTNSYDFGNLFNTPIAFPVALKKSKLDGVAVRIGTPNIKGFQWSTTMGHTRARYFGPQTGGLVFNNDLGNAAVFRIDHDQAFQQTTNLHYQYGKNGPWISFTWRYDSGLVSGTVASLADALALTAAQQSAIGFSCGTLHPTLDTALTAAQCTASNYAASRLAIPAEGTADDDHNPARVASRNLFDVGVGTDNLLRKERFKTTLRLTATNLTNKVALYNFLSTFSGTHFIQPRSYQAALGFVF
ncbi:MAG: TonB-dependent receptor [Acidobacteriota bacterium]